jgi:ATP-binding cassette subfamily B protein
VRAASRRRGRRRAHEGTGESGARIADIALARRIVRELRSWWPQIGAVFAISLLATPLALLVPVPLKIAVDSVLGTQPVPALLDPLIPDAAQRSDSKLLLVTAVMFVAVAAITQLQDLANHALRTYTGERIVLSVRSKLFQRAERLSSSYHDRVGTADSAYRVQQDAQALQYLAVDTVVALVTSVCTLVAMIYVIARIDPGLALIALAVSPPLLLTARGFRRHLRTQARAVKRLESGALSVIQEVLGALRVVKAFGQEDREHDRFLARSGDGMRARVRLAIVEGVYALLVGTLIGIGGALVLYVGVRQVQRDTMTLGDLLLVTGYLSQLYQPLKTMAKRAGTLQAHLASAERVFALLDEQPETAERSDAVPLARALGAVELADVWFAYEEGRPVLRGATLAVLPGTTVGISGVTGAGKTTLMTLLTRLYDPDAGCILLDGRDIRDYRLADLRNQFGIVLQEPVLFSTSIAENIAYARPEAGAHEVIAAARAADAHHFITSLPEGYDTTVGERGMRLSGGERQRISLARAFLKDAPILILDEPTSSVDVMTEAAILDAMRRLMEGRTSFMIAHRLSTLDLCDVRIDVQGGRLVAAGPMSPAGAADAPRQLPDGRRPGRVQDFPDESPGHAPFPHPVDVVEDDAGHGGGACSPAPSVGVGVEGGRAMEVWTEFGLLGVLGRRPRRRDRRDA